MRWYFNSVGKNYRGFVIHDDRTQVATLRVYFSVREFVDVTCDMPMPALKTSGAHETGFCGFVFDNQLMAAIRDKPNFAVFESASGIMLYRRLAGGGFIPSKIFYSQARFTPIHPLLETIRRRSQLSYTSIDRYSRETVISTTNINYSDSIFIAGSLDWVRFEKFITRANFTSVLFIMEPEKMLASTVVGILKARRTDTLPAANLEPELADLANELADIDFDDPEVLPMWETRLTPEARAALANPTIRHLASVPLAVSVGPRNLAAALSVLSRIDIVGTEATDAFFAETVKSSTAIDARYEVLEAARDMQGDDPLAERLAQTEGARNLTNYDRMLYEICNLGLTAEKPDIDDAIDILQRA